MSDMPVVKFQGKDVPPAFVARTQWGRQLYSTPPVEPSSYGEVPRSLSVHVVGLCGAAGAGKDSAAAFLIEDGWERIAFADPLKAVLYDMGIHVTYNGHLWPLTALIDIHGWEWCKVHAPEVRGYLQRLGVAVRNHVADDAWLQAATDKMFAGHKYVVTDARFPNECQAIKRMNGRLLQIDRPGLEALPGNHISEQAWRDQEFDEIIVNDGSLRSLGDKIRRAVA